MKKVRDLGAMAVAAGLLLLVSCGGETSSADGIPADGSLATSTTISGAASAVVDGEMLAAVNGTPHKWYVTHIEQHGHWQSGSFWKPAPMKSATVSISGLTEKGARPTGKGDIRINLIVTDLEGTPKVMAPEITYFADGLAKTWIADEESGAKIMLNRVVLDGDYLDLGGGFSGTVTLGDTGTAASGTDQPREFKIENGAFAIRIRKYEKQSEAHARLFSRSRIHRSKTCACLTSCRSIWIQETLRVPCIGPQPVQRHTRRGISDPACFR